MIAIQGNERVLVCPLGWGLGHASRVIPVISALLLKGCSVVVAADHSSISLLKSHLHNLEFIHFPSVNIKFSKRNNQLFALFGIALKIIALTFREQKKVVQIVREHSIDLVISDNRYGLYCKQGKSILITHQLQIFFPKPFKWAEPIGQWFVKRQAEKFTECWIPDNEFGFRLSGQLSNPKKLPSNARFIGLLSRFYEFNVESKSMIWDLVGIVSGPSPHREIFEKEIIDLSNRLNLRTLVLQGLPQGKTHGKVQCKSTLVSHLPDQEFVSAIKSAKYIVCRSGYSTLMDLMAVGRSALIVPTPGQTEQEYLAKHLSSELLFTSVSQSNMSSIGLSDLDAMHKLSTRTPLVGFFKSFD